MFVNLSNSYEELNTSDVAQLLPITTATKSGKQLIEQLRKKLSARSFEYEEDDVTVDDNISLDIKNVVGENVDFRNESFQHFCSVFAHRQQQHQQHQQQHQQKHQQQQQHLKRFLSASERNNVGNWTMSVKRFLLGSKKRKRSQSAESDGVKNLLKSLEVRKRRNECYRRTAVQVSRIFKSR